MCIRDSTKPSSPQAYVRKLLHFHSPGAVTRPRFTGLRCIYHPNERKNGARRGPRLAQLLDALFRTAHIEVVETLLPDRARAHAAVVKQLRESLFHHFHHHGRIPTSGSVIRRWKCSGITT